MSEPMTLRELRELVERAERDSHLLDGRNFQARRFRAARLLLDLLDDMAAVLSVGESSDEETTA